MSYTYEDERPWLFTEEGSVAFVKARDAILTRVRASGIIRLGDAVSLCGSGDSWKHIAVVDRMVELGDLRKIATGSVGQDDVYEVIR